MRTSFVLLLVLIVSAQAQLKTDWLKCVQDVLSMVKDAEALVEDVQAGNYTNLIADVEKVLADLEPLKTDCNINATLSEFDIKLPVIDNELLTPCVNGIYPAVLQMVKVKDTFLKNGDALQAMVQLMSEFVPLSKLKEECIDGAKKAIQWKLELSSLE